MAGFDLNDLKKLGLTGSITYYFSGEGDDGDWNIHNDNLSFPDNFEDKDDCYQYFDRISMDKLESGWEINAGAIGSYEIDFNEERVSFQVEKYGDLFDFFDEFDIQYSDELLNKIEMDWDIRRYLEYEENIIWDLLGNVIEKKKKVYSPVLSKLDLRGVIFGTARLYGANLSYSNLSNADLSKCGLSYANLSHTNLSNANLNNCSYSFEKLNLSYADLRGADLSEVKLSKPKLKGTFIDNSTKIDDKWRFVWDVVNNSTEGRNLSDTDLSDTDLSGINLKGVNFSKADLSKADLSNADLSNADLTGTNLNGTNLNGTNLNGVSLKSGRSRANLSNANLSGVNLSGFDLSGFDLSGANLCSTNLSNADLSTANLAGVKIDSSTKIDDKWRLVCDILNTTQQRNLSGVDLSNSHFSGADLSGLDLSNANLSGSNLTGANLTGSNLTGAKLTYCKLEKIIIDDKTQITLTKTQLKKAIKTSADTDQNSKIESVEKYQENTAKISESANESPNNLIDNLTKIDKTIEELLSEGYQGVDYELIENEGFVATANHFADKIQWLKTSPDEDGDIALMTFDVQAFDELLDFMLDKFGWCPMVYSNKSAPEIHIFTPQNELEEMAIELTTEGEYGWKGSLYRLAYVEKYENKIGLIFATKPEDSEKQDWLLVQIDQKNKERGWSVHDGTLEQVYYIMAEEIEIPEPNYNPTPEQISTAINSQTSEKIPIHLLEEEKVDEWNQWKFEHQEEELNLSEINLSSCNLSNANLQGVDLSNANLSDADLSGTNLSNANLRSAYLRNANLSDADLSSADLSEANLRRANLEGIITDENTIIEIPEE